MAKIDLTDDRSAPVEERILRAASSYRDALLAHTGALPIVLTRSPATPAAMRPVEVLLAMLADAGLPPCAGDGRHERHRGHRARARGDGDGVRRRTPDHPAARRDGR